MRWLCLASAACASAVPLANQKVFGHSIKNGALPAQTEVTTFEHACGVPPCVVTQLHVPSIYPGHGDAWNWTQGVVSFYIDGETTPSLDLDGYEMSCLPQNDTRDAPFGNSLFGKGGKKSHSRVHNDFLTYTGPATEGELGEYWHADGGRRWSWWQRGTQAWRVVAWGHSSLKR